MLKGRLHKVGSVTFVSATTNLITDTPVPDRIVRKSEVMASDGTRVSRTLLLVFFLHSISALIVQFVFPPGVAAKGWTLWSMNFGQWCSVQFFFLSVLAFGIVVHVMLHWSWVCGVIARKLLHQRELPDDGIRTVYGVGLLILLLLSGATIVGIAMMSIKMPLQ